MDITLSVFSDRSGTVGRTETVSMGRSGTGKVSRTVTGCVDPICTFGTGNMGRTSIGIEGPVTSSVGVIISYFGYKFVKILVS